MGSILKHFLLPIYIRIDERIAIIQEFLQLDIGIGFSKTIVQTCRVQGIGIVIGTYHVGSLRVKLELV